MAKIKNLYITTQTNPTIYSASILNGGVLILIFFYSFNFYKCSKLSLKPKTSKFRNRYLMFRSGGKI